ncbi:MAG: hypothetical protein CM1200mP18_18010 [Gammaproteobacteria bacterium]|nr:MAG: hypothetical protein CM1200mP18_18010 [Gammaproteobacteria bacterium]
MQPVVRRVQLFCGLAGRSEQPWPLVDLRVDWAERPVDELRQCWERYEPEMMAYLTRALNPGAAPTYGVPGDE